MSQPMSSQIKSARPPFHWEKGGLMESFRYERVKTSGAEINVAIGGNGPPLLLLHGNPLTHVSWHKIAPALAKSFTLVMPDLRGYGDSSKPDGGEDHSGYSFRSMGQDNAEVMTHFGFDRFQVAGHDRGARVAFRMALDFPDRIERVAALDIVPTHHALTNVTLGWGLEAYHWFFMAQKAPFPEKLLTADLSYYIDYKLNKKGVGLEIFSPEASAAPRLSRSTPSARIIAPPSASIWRWIPPTTMPSARSPARYWCSGVATAIAAAISSRSRPGSPGRLICAAGTCRPGITLPSSGRT